MGFLKNRIRKIEEKIRPEEKEIKIKVTKGELTAEKEKEMRKANPDGILIVVRRDEQ